MKTKRQIMEEFNDRLMFTMERHGMLMAKWQSALMRLDDERLEELEKELHDNNVESCVWEAAIKIIDKNIAPWEE